MHAVGTLGLDMTLRSVAHCVASAYQPVAAEAYAAEEVLLLKHARHELEVIRTSGVHFVREFRLVARDELVKALLAAPQLVAQGQHAEGGMAAEGTEHPEAFLHQVCLFCFIVLFLPGSSQGTPEGKLRLHVDTQQIRSGKGSLRRTGGVVAVVVDAIGFGNAEQPEPLCQIRGGGTGERKEHAVVLAPEHDGCAVDLELHALCAEGS